MSPRRHARAAAGRHGDADPALWWSTLAFAAIVLAGFVVYLTLGRHLWFYSDEWDYVVDRHLSQPASLFRAHNGQWQTIPIVVWRMLLHFTGLRTYLPYLVLTILLYLFCCTLLYVLMLRARIRPAIAAVAGGTSVFLGFAASDAVFAAQLTYFGSIAFGLGALLVATRPPTRPRTIAIIGLGIAALMCSNLGVVTAVIVAAETLLRHGWRRALSVTAPPAAAFIAWWLFDGAAPKSAGVCGVVRFVGTGLAAAGREFTQLGNTGVVLLVVLLAVGLACARAHRREDAAIIGPLALGALTFLAITGSQRVAAFGVSSAGAPRYAHIVVLLLLPAAAAAASSIWNRSRAAGIIATAVLLVGVPGNLSSLSSLTTRAAHVSAVRALILAVPHLPEAGTVPADMRPFPESNTAPLLTVGYLRQAATSGVLPDSAPPTKAQRAAVMLRLSLYQTTSDRPPTACRPLTEPTRITLQPGATLHLAGGFVRVVNLTPGPAHGQKLYYNPNRGNMITVLHKSLTLKLSSYGINGKAQICGQAVPR